MQGQQLTGLPYHKPSQWLEGKGTSVPGLRSALSPEPCQTLSANYVSDVLRTEIDWLQATVNQGQEPCGCYAGLCCHHQDA